MLEITKKVEKVTVSTADAVKHLRALYDAGLISKLVNGNYVVCTENGWTDFSENDLSKELKDDLMGLRFIRSKLYSKDPAWVPEIDSFTLVLKDGTEAAPLLREKFLLPDKTAAMILPDPGAHDVFSFVRGEEETKGPLTYIAEQIAEQINGIASSEAADLFANKYAIRYTETYESVYTVQAESFEEAKEKLGEAIRNGLEGPQECVDSSYEALRLEPESIHSFDVV